MLKHALIAITTITLASTAQAAQDGWWTGFGMGVFEHMVENGPGNSINVNCAEGAMRGASIIFTIRNKSPAADSKVRVFINNSMYEFYISKATLTAETESRVEAANFQAFWYAMRSAKTIRVLFENGDTSTFSTKGAAKIFRQKICKTGFEM
jgi:hypothetical protein